MKQVQYNVAVFFKTLLIHFPKINDLNEADQHKE